MTGTTGVPFFSSKSQRSCGRPNTMLAQVYIILRVVTRSLSKIRPRRVKWVSAAVDATV